jgi:hypothetical protein
MMQKKPLPRWPSGLFLLALIVSMGFATGGCSGGLKRPAVHPVEGRVTFDGAPIEGVGVSFSPVVPGKGGAAFGKTLSDGSFRLTSTQGGLAGAGAMAGEYAVMFQKFMDVDPGDVPRQTKPATTDATRQVPRWFSRQEASRSEDNNTIRYVILGLLPEAYAKADSSGFRATVVPGRNTGEAFTFHLQSDYEGPVER